MARLKVKQISDFDSKVNSLITAGTTDEAASIDSLESLASSNFATVSDALSTEIDATSTDVKTLSDALSVEILATSGDVKVLSDALSTEIAATNDDVTSIDLVVGTMGTGSALTAVSDALSVEISSTNSDVVRIDDLLASVATDTELSDAVSVEKLRAETAEGALAQADEYVHQIGTFRSATSFAITGVRFAAKEDLLVFINGHNIHPVVGENGMGWSTVDGVNFTLTNIGYDLEADDHVYVTGVEL